MQNNRCLRVVFGFFVVCYSLVANSINKREISTKDDLQDKDTIQVLSESDSLFVQGKFLYEKHKYRMAINSFLKSDSVIKVHYGTDCPYFGYGKMWASCCYHELGMDSIAIKYSNYYDKQPINKLLTHSSDSVVWIALKMLDSGQIKNAAEKLLEAASLEKQELGPNNYWYANTLSNCGDIYHDIGDFEKAIELGKEAVEIYKKTFGTDHPNYATCLNNLALSYSDSGNFLTAIQLSKDVLEIVKKNYGIENPNYAAGLNNLATNYADFGNYFIAIQLAKEAVDIKRRTIGTEHPDYATDLGNLAEHYSSIGNYSEALLLGKNAMNIRKRVLGTEHPDYALSLINVANYYSAVGNYPEALRLGTEALDIFKKTLGATHPYYAMSLSRLANYNSNLGNFTTALMQETNAMKIIKDVLGVEHTEYVSSLGRIALRNSEVGNYIEAINIEKEVLELYENKYGVESPKYVYSLARLASYYSGLGNYVEANRIGEKALEIWQKVFGSEHSDYARLLDGLAKFSAGLGNYSEAILLSKKANKIVERTLGTEHLDYSLSLRNIGLLNIYIGNYAEAYSYLKQFIDYSQSYILNNFVELSSNLRESLWTGMFAPYYIGVFPSIVGKYNNKESISELYNKTCLFAKGILLNTDLEIRNLVLESGDSALITKYNNFSSNISVYNKLIEIPKNRRFVNADSLSNVIQRQEMELVKDSKAYGDYTHNLTINWRDVQRGLGDNDIAIEFLDFPVYKTDTTMYVALTLKKGYDSPRMVTLFKGNQLKAIPESSYYTHSDVSSLVWKPLKEELEGITNIYFAPSGDLHRIGIEYLPISNTKNINDIFKLHRLSSTRQLAVIHDETKGKNNILYGGINYDKKSKTISTDSASTRRAALRSAFSYRANVDSMSLRNSFEYLEGTKRETDLIAEDMKQHSVPYKYYCGSDATEESFKNLDGTRPMVMHIATHGFYYTEAEAEKSQFVRSEIELLTEGAQNVGRFVENKSMTRSGLLFSGCNHTICHEQIPEGEENGILTAQEISTLDLRGLDLVVLSACQTGLGDIISGEGVFGLQRGFKKAGAKTIIMSLWNVNDESTMKMMTSFYHHYLEGLPKEEAFYKAQEELRKECPSQQERPDWAAFILLDGLN